MKKKLNYILILLSIIAVFATIWVRDAYGKASLDQILFHLQVPAEGVSNDIIVIILYECFVKSLVVFILVLLFNKLLSLFFKNEYIKLVYKNKSFNLLPFDFKNKFWFFCSLVILLFVFTDTIIYYDVIDFTKNTFNYSTFIEDNYVDPNNVKLTFKDKKRNLIYIFVESFETSYASKNVGGSFKYNLIPNMYNLAINNTSFSNNNYFGGLEQISDTDWTIAGIVSQTSGIPLKVSTDGKLYQKDGKFLNNAKTLGDILKENGYNQTFLLGSNALFGGRYAYFKTHGNYNIKDYKYFKENKIIDDDYYVFWGFPDSKLYDFAKDELKSIQEPFNLTMLTVNNHTPNGYLECDSKYEKQIENVISCTDLQLYEFVNWVKKQPFYENTTIIIVGDHINMDSTFIEDMDNRKIYNVIINGKTPIYKQNRLASSFDMFPTTLYSLGVEIEGNRLGLGTNLYSSEETILEKYGISKVNEEIKKKSKYYDDKFLFN